MVLAQTRDPKLDALAEKLALKINQKSFTTKKESAPKTYLVFDFKEPSGRSTQLANHLADQVSESLMEKLPHLTPVERPRLVALLEQERLDRSSLQTEVIALWAAKTLGAKVLIFGSIEPEKDRFKLRLRVTDDRQNPVAEGLEHLEWNEERQAWSRIPSPALPRDVPWPGVPELGPGMKTPVCLRCPTPSYTDEARGVRLQGDLRVRLLIAEDGRVTKIAPVTGLPFGMTSQAVAVVQKWMFKPVLGHEGKPVAVQFLIDVNFQLR
jgi:TonB family protein